MPQGPAIEWDLTVTEKSPRAAIEWIVNVASGRSDFIRWDLDVINLLDIAGQPSSYVGASIEMDRGDGTLALIPKSDLDAEIRLRGSINGFGARELSFSRFGSDQSPFKSNLLRSMRPVRFTGYSGLPGAIGSRVMFDGYIRDGSFEGYPPLARIDCQDASLLFADKPLFYNVEPGSLKVRTDVILDVLAQAGITAGVFEAPQGSGIFFKAISEAGDKKVLDWLQQVIDPIGARGYWRRGKWNFKRFDTSAAPVRTLKAGDFYDISIDPPPSNAPNQVKVSTSMYSYTGPSGQRTVIEDSVTNGIYAPLVATSKQDKTTGVISALSLTSVSTTRPVKRVITTTTYDGGTLISQNVSEYGWYAPRAANKQIGGANAWNDQFDVYKYADGSWRTTSEEQFILIRSPQVARQFDADGYLFYEDAAVYRFAPVEIPRGTLNAGTGAEVPVAVLTTDEGIAWQLGKEQLYAEHNTITWYATPDHRVAQRSLVVKSNLRPEYYQVSNPGGAYSGATIYYFGPSNAKIYAIAVSGNDLQLATVDTYYSAISESQHSRKTTTSFNYTFYPTSFQLGHLGDLGTGGGTYAGPVPYLEQKTSNQQAQQATITFTDELRKSLSRDIAITDYRQNESCETDGEALTVAIEAIRALGAPIVTINMPIDWVIEEGNVIAVADHPDLGYGVVKLLVTDMEWTINGSTGDNNQRVTCRWYPPELANAA